MANLMGWLFSLNEVYPRPRDAFDRKTERKDMPFNSLGLFGGELPYHRTSHHHVNTRLSTPEICRLVFSSHRQQLAEPFPTIRRQTSIAVSHQIDCGENIDLDVTVLHIIHHIHRLSLGELHPSPKPLSRSMS